VKQRSSAPTREDITMNTTTAITAHDTGSETIDRRNRYIRAGLIAGLAAAAVNTIVVAVADAGDVSLTVDDSGRPIPLVGFAQVTFISALIGIAIAAVVRRRSARPVERFTRITVALTALSLIPRSSSMPTRRPAFR
jgi:hypothetical protein